MPAATLTVGNVEITPILDVDTSMPLGNCEFFGRGGGIRTPDLLLRNHNRCDPLTRENARLHCSQGVFRVTRDPSSSVGFCRFRYFSATSSEPGWSSRESELAISSCSVSEI